jgi:hypothetical protein
MNYEAVLENSRNYCLAIAGLNEEQRKIFNIMFIGALENHVDPKVYAVVANHVKEQITNEN